VPAAEAECPAGQYKALPVASADHFKAATGDTACSGRCPTNSSTGGLTGFTAGTACVANAGYTGPDGGPFTACLADHFKAATGNAAAPSAPAAAGCTGCPPNSATGGIIGSTAATACVTDKGYTGSNGGTPGDRLG
jgi:hypothetical protein